MGDRGRQRVGSAAAGVAVALLVAATAPAASRAPARPAPVADAGAYQARLFDLLNAERARHGLRHLEPASCAADQASHWAQQMARDHWMRHQPMRKLLEACQARRAAENIAMGNVPPERMMASWMHSPRHRDNILDPRLTHVGLGAELASGGRWYGVVDFFAR